MTDDKKIDIKETQDAIIEIAKDLLMIQGIVLLLEGLDAAERGELGAGVVPVRFASQTKTDAFHRLVVAVHAARAAAEEFRISHVQEERDSIRATMERQFRDELRRIDDDGDVERKRSS